MSSKAKGRRTLNKAKEYLTEQGFIVDEVELGGNMPHYVYAHIRLDSNSVFYIGIGTQEKDSMYSRAKSTVGRNKIWHGISNRSGWDYKIIFESDNYQAVKDAEMCLISYFGKIIDKTGCLSNITDGGDGALGYCHTEESKRIISKHSRKHDLVVSYTTNGFISGIYGSVKEACLDGYSSNGIYNSIKKDSLHSDMKWFSYTDINQVVCFIGEFDDAATKSGKAHRGLKRSQESKDKMSKIMTGRTLSDETKQKLRNANIGKKLPKSVIDKMVKNRIGKYGKKVVHLDSGREFTSLSMGCKEYNLNYKAQHRAMKKGFSTAKFKWCE